MTFEEKIFSKYLFNKEKLREYGFLKVDNSYKYTTYIVDNSFKVEILIKDNNVKVGIAINPETRLYSIIPYLEIIDLVLVMGVKPGFGGQGFIKETINKINELKAIQPKYNFIKTAINVGDSKGFGIKNDMSVCGHKY